MSRRYSIAEARSRLARIVAEAETGAPIELTRRGRPVAVLVSHQGFQRLRGQQGQFGSAYSRFLETHDLEEIGIDDDFAYTERDRTPGRGAIAEERPIRTRRLSP
ncbi:MAG TPA: type II toxin-antitoxin system prevent-host-death family antitoxin [Vicinamibacterales bacterium]|nr:type II toxin-antitoxin system prevent-host-death family antitoxin [Vicinamibacterales bacterium]